MRIYIKFFSVYVSVMLVLVIVLMPGCAKQDTADMIFWNGNIVTMEADMPRAEAIAVKDDRIIKVGSNEEVDMYKNANTKVIDLEGKTVIPGMSTITNTNITETYTEKNLI